MSGKQVKVILGTAKRMDRVREGEYVDRVQPKIISGHGTFRRISGQVTAKGISGQCTAKSINGQVQLV